MKKINIVFAFLVGLSCFAQEYNGTIKKVTKDGLHRGLISSEIRTAAANDNFDGIRIKDADNEEVPYVLFYKEDKSFSTYSSIPILNKEVYKDSLTSITVENKTKEKQYGITLRIANTSINKAYNIYGSNNNEDWFGLLQGGRLSSLDSSQNTFFEKTIYFPLNTYKYLRFDFLDNTSLPINILNAGLYTSAFFKQEPIELSHFTQNSELIEDKKVTILSFSAKDKHSINTVSFQINTKFYLRKVNVIVERTRKVKKRTETYKKTLASFQLNSKNTNTFVLSNFNEKEFSIEIENNDNPPLQIENVTLYQKPIYLLTLRKNNLNLSY